MADGADETTILIGAKNTQERKQILAEIFMGHRDRLRSMVHLRIDRRLRARVDPSDVLQDAFIEAQKRLDQYLAASPSPMPFYLWLRRITAQKLIDVQRFHLAEKRAAEREVEEDPGGVPQASSEAMALAIIARGPSPSEVAAQGELKSSLEAALDRMDSDDREVLALRHFEDLSGPETAQLLGISVEAARKRYLRALEKFREVLAGLPGGPSEH
jgi:RNA polymerase sigma-70 factor (ECF subfamily)